MAQPQPLAHRGLALPMDLSEGVPIPFFDPLEDAGNAFLGCFSLFFLTSSFLSPSSIPTRLPLNSLFKPIAGFGWAKLNFWKASYVRLLIHRHKHC